MHKLFPKAFLVLVVLSFFGCEYKDVPPETAEVIDCTKSSLAITLVKATDASACNLIDGAIKVSGNSGKAPYAYSINGGTYQIDSVFNNLGPGIYTIQIIDANKCTRAISVDVSAQGATLDATFAAVEDSDCLGGNGSITITPTGGTAPYAYRFGTGAFGSANSFTGLQTGNYTVTVQDANGCPKAVNVTVARGNSHVSYASDIAPIVNTNCAISGCHNGDNGASRNWTVFSNFQKNAQNIKLRTGNKSMPLGGSLTDAEIALIACWVDDGANNN